MTAIIIAANVINSFRHYSLLNNHMKLHESKKGKALRTFKEKGSARPSKINW